MEFKIGDIVRERYHGNRGNGKIIKVIKNSMNQGFDLFCVEFEENWGGHGGAGHVVGKPGHCWNYEYPVARIHLEIVPQYKWRKL